MAKRSFKINYIAHLNQVNQMITEDNRLSAWHVSLYYALFHLWNAGNFNNPIIVNRSELMKAAKIGSINTYHKGLHQLEEWNYIKYQPSHNPFRGSSVYMFIFDTTSNTTDATTINTTWQTANKQPMSPLNKPIETNKKEELTIKNNESKLTLTPPDLDEVLNFFKENNSVKREAELFFLHYESIGWKSGKNQIHNWRALAKKWMMNQSMEKESKNQGKETVDRLIVSPSIDHKKAY